MGAQQISLFFNDRWMRRRLYTPIIATYRVDLSLEYSAFNDTEQEYAARTGGRRRGDIARW